MAPGGHQRPPKRAQRAWRSCSAPGAPSPLLRTQRPQLHTHPASAPAGLVTGGFPRTQGCRGLRPSGWGASWRARDGVGTAPQSPSALLWAPRKLAQLTLVAFPRGPSGLACPRAFYLCAGQRVLVHKSLDKLFRPDVPQPFLHQKEKRSREGGDPWAGHGIGGLACPPAGSLSPPREGLWTPALLTSAPQPRSGLSQSLKPCPRAAVPSSWGAGGNVPKRGAWEV